MNRMIELRPTTHRVPSGCVRCAICGAAIDLFTPARGNKYPTATRDFMKEHEICVSEKAPAAGCVIDECLGIGVGPMQRCEQHGGYRSLKEMKNKQDLRNALKGK